MILKSYDKVTLIEMLPAILGNKYFLSNRTILSCENRNTYLLKSVTLL